MSGINAINSANVSFSGKKEVEEAKPKKKSFASKVATTVTKPVKDSFEKKYGKGTEPTPKLVGDYIVDTALKLVVPVATGIVLFTKLRKNTNGLTKAIKDTATDGTKRSVKDFFKTVTDQVKKNNELADKAKKAADVVDDAAKKAGEAIGDTAKKAGDAIGDAVEGVAKKQAGAATGEGSKIINIADKVKKAADIKGADGKIDLYKAADVGVSAAITAGVTSGAIEVTDAVTSEDDVELAGGTVIKIKDQKASEMFSQLTQAASVISQLGA